MTGSLVLKDCILFAVKLDENKDDMIDEDDPTCLFLCSKDGNDLKQITPKDFSIVSYKISQDFKTIFINGIKAKDGKFQSGNEILYAVYLDKDFSKIKLTQINP